MYDKLTSRFVRHLGVYESIKRKRVVRNSNDSLEVPGGFEPPYTVLQTVA